MGRPGQLDPLAGFQQKGHGVRKRGNTKRERWIKHVNICLKQSVKLDFLAVSTLKHKRPFGGRVLPGPDQRPYIALLDSAFNFQVSRHGKEEGKGKVYGKGVATGKAQAGRAVDNGEVEEMG